MVLRSALVISEHAMVRDVVCSIVDRNGAIGPVVEASTGRDGRRLALEQRPDLTLVDEPLEGRLASEVAPPLREVAPDTRLVLFTTHIDNPYAAAAFEAGARAYLLKERLHSDLDAAISTVLAGDRYLGQPFALPLG